MLLLLLLLLRHANVLATVQFSSVQFSSVADSLCSPNSNSKQLSRTC